jgi:segregation and condensation protein B
MEMSSKTLEEIEETKEKDNLKLLEAVFFVSGRFLKMQEIISLTDLNPILINDLIDKLKQKYSKEDSAIEIVEKGGMWKMDVRQEYVFIINKLATGSSEFTKAEQETLAIIAYKQPIKQSVIIKIRGNKAYDHIHKFLQLSLIKSKKEGHTNLLSLSEDFYDYFSVSDEGIPLKDVAGLDEAIEEADKEDNSEDDTNSFQDLHKKDSEDEESEVESQESNLEEKE